MLFDFVNKIGINQCCQNYISNNISWLYYIQLASQDLYQKVEIVDLELYLYSTSMRKFDKIMTEDLRYQLRRF